MTKLRDGHFILLFPWCEPVWDCLRLCALQIVPPYLSAVVIDTCRDIQIFFLKDVDTRRGNATKNATAVYKAVEYIEFNARQ